MNKSNGTSATALAGVSIRNGPVLEDKMDIDAPATNGVAKRKARVSAGKAVKYNNSSESDDVVPLVRRVHSSKILLLIWGNGC